MSTNRIRIGSRGSSLALFQASHITSLLQAAWPEVVCETIVFSTRGDKTLDAPLPEIGGKGLFTAELEQALRDEFIDIAVHSLKDLPVEDSPAITVGAVTSRADVRDVLVARDGWTIETLPGQAVVGTSSLRREAQILMIRPDLRVRSIRGNVETRVRKVIDGVYDATVMAAAGLQRLNLTEHISEFFNVEDFLPAAGQAALAVQCRAEDDVTLAFLAAIDEKNARAATTAERSFLSALDSGCSAPVGAYARIAEDALIHLSGLVASRDGLSVVRVEGRGMDAVGLGRETADRALTKGAKEILSDEN